MVKNDLHALSRWHVLAFYLKKIKNRTRWDNENVCQQHLATRGKCDEGNMWQWSLLFSVERTDTATPPWNFGPIPGHIVNMRMRALSARDWLKAQERNNDNSVTCILCFTFLDNNIPQEAETNGLLSSQWNMCCWKRCCVQIPRSISRCFSLTSPIPICAFNVFSRY